MSVVVAGICGPESSVVLATDRMPSVTDGAFSTSESAHYGQYIARDWVALFAAGDASVVPLLMDRLTAGRDETETPTAESMRQRVVDAFLAEIQRKATDTLLAPYGLTMERFLDGRARLGDQAFLSLFDQIARVTLDCQILMCGFADRHPQVFIVEDAAPNRGVLRDHSFLGYWAIGSGAESALNSLAVRGHTDRCSLADTIYNVCEAKFAAEAAGGVSTETFVLVYGPDRSWTVMEGPLCAELRKEWNRVGRPRYPTRAVKAIEGWYDTSKKMPPLTLPKRAPRPLRSGATTAPRQSTADQDIGDLPFLRRAKDQ